MCLFLKLVSHRGYAIEKGTKYAKSFENVFCLVKSFRLALTLRSQCGTIVSRVIDFCPSFNK